MAGAFVFPAYFVFSSKGVKAFWLLPFKKTVYWSAVNSIVEYKRFFSDDGSAKYVLNYRSEYNGRQTVREFELPRSKKIKKLVEKYAKYKII